MRRKKVERKGRRLRWGRAAPLMIQLMISAPRPYQEGKVQGQQPIRGPVGLLPSSLCCQGPPSPVSPWDSGSGGQSPGQGHLAQSGLSSSQRPCLALPKTQRGPLPRPPDSGEAQKPAGGEQPAPLPTGLTPAPLGSQFPGVPPTPL